LIARLLPVSEEKQEPEGDINSQAQRAMSFLAIQAHASPLRSAVAGALAACFRKETRIRERDQQPSAASDVVPLYPSACFARCARLSIARLLPVSE
jgi:hypothetical protein